MKQNKDGVALMKLSEARHLARTAGDNQLINAMTEPCDVEDCVLHQAVREELHARLFVRKQAAESLGDVLMHFLDVLNEDAQDVADYKEAIIRGGNAISNILGLVANTLATPLDEQANIAAGDTSRPSRPSATSTSSKKKIMN